MTTRRYFGPKFLEGMGPKDTKLWAREEIMDAIDAMIKDKKEGVNLTVDDELALKKERARVAKFLGMPIL